MRAFAILLVFLDVPVVVDAAPGPVFQGLGDLPGGRFHSEALALSEDGQVVVGRSASAQFEDEGFMRVRDGTLVPLVASGGRHVAGEPRAITPGGRAVAGKIALPGRPLVAARWSRADGWTSLPDLDGGGADGQALGMSPGGDVIVGWGSSAAGLEAALWRRGTVTSLGDLPGGVHQSAASLVSHDGTIVVGTGLSARGPEVFVWSEATGMIGLGDLPGGAFSSEPFGMTADASVIVGEAASAQGVEAMRWTRSEGMQGLGDLPGGAFHSLAFDVSANGAIVVGTATTGQDAEAFVWEAARGMRRLADVLLEQGADEVRGWRLTEAIAISASGHVIVGNGTNPAGQSEAWMAVLAR